MQHPRALVIPFAVPEEGQGLGLGLAALVHGFAQVEGGSVALAQLHARQSDGPNPLAPVEAFIPPQAWRDLAGPASAPPDLKLIVTGAFDPPGEGRGALQLLAFDPHDGSTRARVDVHLDDDRAGESLYEAFADVWDRIGGDLGLLRDVRHLGWDALESVLRAERCALHDPVRGGPYDRLAAMLHLGRAIEEAPSVRFPAERLAGLALETASPQPFDPKLTEAALRALLRAADDAPDRLELVEASAALEVRLGRPRDAERRMNALLARAADRPRAYAILAESLRAQGRLDAALAVLQAGLEALPQEIDLLVDRGAILALAGDEIGAIATWQSVLSRAVHPRAFAGLAGLVTKRGDATTAQSLVDYVLSHPTSEADMIRRGIQLALGAEPEGIARASRVARLARSLCEGGNEDPWGRLVLARALRELGDTAGAREQLDAVGALVPGSAFAAEADRLRFALDHPDVALEVDAVTRAASEGSGRDLEPIAARARRLAHAYGAWPAWLAVGIAERRRGRWREARDALRAASELAPGAPAVHAQLVPVLIALGAPAAALHHAERTRALEGDTPRTLALLGRALLSSGKKEDARAVLHRALALDPNDDAVRQLAEQLDGDPRPAPRGALGNMGAKLKEAWSRWRRE